MPKSKRARVVHTSSVQKKPSKEKSASLYATIQATAPLYPHIFAFSVQNMRNTYLKDVRHAFSSDGRLFLGKTKVMAKALGASPEDELLPNLSRLSVHLAGTVGLLFTTRPVPDVLDFFARYVEIDFARAGLVAPRTVTVPPGVVYSRAGALAPDDDVPLPHSQEVTVRKWGMPTRLDRGRVLLDAPFTVCEAGRVLDSHQTALLKLFGVALAEFRVRVVAYWSGGEVTTVGDEGGMEE